MGNCMDTCLPSPVADDFLGNIEAADWTAAGYDADDDCGQQKGSPSPAGEGEFKVKIVLTKAELKWLLLRLNEEKGGGLEGTSLEQALQEIQKERKKDGAGEKQGRTWKPSLERIMECPETQSFDDDQLHR